MPFDVAQPPVPARPDPAVLRCHRATPMTMQTPSCPKTKATTRSARSGAIEIGAVQGLGARTVPNMGLTAPNR